jgi:hypothetical protein
MTEPPTMLLREPDDDRTLIDPRFSAARSDKPLEGPGGAAQPADLRPSIALRAAGARRPRQHAMLSERRGRTVEMGVVLALVFGLGSVAYQQRRAVDALRDAIEEMRVGSPTSPAHELLGSEGRERAQVGPEARVEALIPEVSSSERDQLEHRGASLIGSNNFVGALTHYQTLAELFPKKAAFGDVVTVLKAKLRCAEPASSRCP